MAEIPPALGAPRSGVTPSEADAAGGPDPRWSGRAASPGLTRTRPEGRTPAGAVERMHEADAGGGCRRRMQEEEEEEEGEGRKEAR